MRLHVEVDGPTDAPALVLVPSLGSDHTMWRLQVADLAHDHRVLRVDPRGHGGSPTPPGPYELADLGTDVVEAADEHGVDRFDLVGVSLGGLTALWVAIHHADRVRSLVAANTAARVGTAEGWWARIGAVREHGLAGIRDAVFARFFSDGFADRDPVAYAEAQEAFARADDDGYAACCAALASADLRDDVHRITTPTLVVAGEHDVATPLEDAAWLRDHVPGARLIVLEGAAHLSNLEQPAAFTRAVRGHVDAARPRT